MTHDIIPIRLPRVIIFFLDKHTIVLLTPLEHNNVLRKPKGALKIKGKIDKLIKNMKKHKLVIYNNYKNLIL